MDREIDRCLSEAEYRRLLKAAKREGAPWYLWIVVVLATNVGLRRRNLLSLRWNQINLRSKVVRIENTEAKGKKTVWVPLNDSALSALKEAQKVTGEFHYVFAHLKGRHRGQPIADVKNAFRSALREAGIKPFRFHDLRHTFCSWLAERRTPLMTIKELAGHASIKTTLRYAHLSPDHRAEAIKALDEIKAA